MGRLRYGKWIDSSIWPNAAHKADSKFAMSTPDLTILYSQDGKEWDQYLTDCFQLDSEPVTLEINHEKLEDLPFPLPCSRVQSFSNSKAVLVILSPDFLEYIDSHPAEVFELGQLLKQNRTVAMLCGILDSDVTTFHKASLVYYDSWPHLVARDQDMDFVVAVIHTTQEIIERTHIQKPQFKLSPRKVKEGNGKVFIILKRPISETQKIQVLLNGDGVHKVPVKYRNAYTLQFVIPDNMMQKCKIMNVLVQCDDYLLGIRPLKCESKMSELYSLLSVVNSPFDFLCSTLGVNSLSEIDAQLTKNFKHNKNNLPSPGFSLLESYQNLERKKCDEELPTLLHFSARYGLKELTSQLLQCPGAAQACSLRNSRGLIPSQLAYHAGYNDISKLLDDFKKLTETEKSIQTMELRKSHLSTVYEQMKECPGSLYDVPLPNPIPVPNVQKSCTSSSSSAENDYLGMLGFKPADVDNLEPHKKLLLGLDTSKELLDNLSSLSIDNSSDSLENLTDNVQEEKLENYTIKENVLSESQQELAKILESYKYGKPLSEVINHYHSWRHKYEDSLDETKDSMMGKDLQNSGVCNKSLSERPPAPPPRPSISLPIARKKPNLKHTYYVFPPVPTKDKMESVSPDYVQPDMDCYLPASKIDATINKISGKQLPATPKKPSKSIFNIESNQRDRSLNKVLPTVYKRQNGSSSSQSATVHEQDECHYYDIPAVPVPVEKSNAKDNYHLQNEDSNYDIPKSLSKMNQHRRRSSSNEPTYIEVFVSGDDHLVNNGNLDYDIPKPFCCERNFKSNSLPRQTNTYAGIINQKEKSAPNYYNVLPVNDEQFESIPDELPPPPPSDEDNAYNVMVPISSPNSERHLQVTSLPSRTQFDIKSK
ncbi:phosphoinositide 3-kinase adapter protein 1 isoform X4 [Centruroides vittatus]|uniref:phosphoinositide 3-kinase adapter protein 1 isoform X4 n=1 Tax=Centruroides vittatus TaxID=120091 RepID=UPI00350EF6C7